MGRGPAWGAGGEGASVSFGSSPCWGCRGGAGLGGRGGGTSIGGGHSDVIEGGTSVTLPPSFSLFLPPSSPFQVALLIIDEIHLLGADRGPILEVIVSRMR